MGVWRSRRGFLGRAGAYPAAFPGFAGRKNVKGAGGLYGEVRQVKRRVQYAS